MTVLKIVVLFILQAVAFVAYVAAGFAAVFLVLAAIGSVVHLIGNQDQIDELQAWLVFFAYIGAFAVIATVGNFLDALFSACDAERKAIIVRWKYDRQTRRLYPNAGKPSLDFR